MRGVGASQSRTRRRILRLHSSTLSSRDGMLSGVVNECRIVLFTCSISSPWELVADRAMETLRLALCEDIVLQMYKSEADVNGEEVVVDCRSGQVADRFLGSHMMTHLLIPRSKSKETNHQTLMVSRSDRESESIARLLVIYTISFGRLRPLRSTSRVPSARQPAPPRVPSHAPFWSAPAARDSARRS